MHRRSLALSAMPACLLMAMMSCHDAEVDAQAVGCTIGTAPVAFGTYDVFSAGPTDSTGSVSYNCFLLVGFTVRIDLGTGGSGGYSPRQLFNGGNTLNYNLYRDAARASVWGDGTGGTSFFSVNVLPFLPTSGTVTIYGRVPALQDAQVGAFGDTVVATITF